MKKNSSASKISEKFQIVIPKEVRESIPLRKGQKIHFITIGKVIHLVPDVDLESLRGCIPRGRMDDIREEEDID